MNGIKKVLASVISQQTYLKILHRSFYLLYNTGFLKGKPSYKYHYKVQEIIQPDDVIVDIGANLGYFAKTFSNLTPKGKVICIEPVPGFYSILKHFLGKRNNVVIHNVALGSEPGVLDMVLPEEDGVIRTGLPHIAKDEAEKAANKTVAVQIVRGSELLLKETRISYIKCDIEGYEWNVFQEIKPVLEQFRPIVQLEISDNNEVHLLPFFQELNYERYGIANYKFVKESGSNQQEQGDYLFIPKEKAADFEKKHLGK